MLQSAIRKLSVKSVKSRVVLFDGLDCIAYNKTGLSRVISADRKSGPCPGDELLTSLAACSGSGVRFLLEKRGHRVNSLVTTVEADIVDNPRRFDNIRITHELDAAGVEQSLLDKIVKQIEDKMCPVSQTLKHPPVLSVIEE